MALTVLTVHDKHVYTSIKMDISMALVLIVVVLVGAVCIVITAVIISRRSYSTERYSCAPPCSYLQMQSSCTSTANSGYVPYAGFGLGDISVRPDNIIVHRPVPTNPAGFIMNRQIPPGGIVQARPAGSNTMLYYVSSFSDVSSPPTGVNMFRSIVYHGDINQRVLESFTPESVGLLRRKGWDGVGIDIESYTGSLQYLILWLVMVRNAGMATVVIVSNTGPISDDNDFDWTYFLQIYYTYIDIYVPKMVTYDTSMKYDPEDPGEYLEVINSLPDLRTVPLVPTISDIEMAMSQFLYMYGYIV